MHAPVRTLSLFTAAAMPVLLTTRIAVGQPDPGTIAVVGEAPAQVNFSFAGGTPYRLNYPTGLEQLWFDQAMTIPANTGTTYTSYAHDMNGDGSLDGRDITGFVTALINGPYSAAADWNGDSLVNVNDVPLFVNALLSGYPASGAVLFVQGLSASTSIGDAAVELLTDPNHTGTFTHAQTAAATVVDISISPPSGGLATPLTITMSPALSPLVFNTTTTAQWRGFLQPVVGNPTAPFAITYSASQFHESSAGEATILVGDGSAAGVPAVADLEGPGSLVGTVTISLGGRSIAKGLTFYPDTGAATWERVNYPDGPHGVEEPLPYGPPSFGTLAFLTLSDTDDPTHPDQDFLIGANDFHSAAVLRVAENAATTMAAPASVTVKLITYDATGVQLDQVDHVVLTKMVNDGDPNNIVYHNDLRRPIIMLDTFISRAAYPDVIPLTVVDGGSAVIVPSPN